MKLLYGVLLFIWLVSPSTSWAQSFLIDRVDVNCLNPSRCEHYKDFFVSIKGSYSSVGELRESFKAILSGQAIRSAAFDLIKDTAGRYHLQIDIEVEQTIKSIKFAANHPVAFAELVPFMPFREGEWFDPQKAGKAKEEIVKFLANRGYDQITVQLQQSGEQELDLLFDIKMGKTIIVTEINYKFETTWRDSQVYELFNHFKGKPWNRLLFKVAQEKLMMGLFEQGFFFAKARIRHQRIKKEHGDVIVEVYIDRGARYNFHFNFGQDLTIDRSEIIAKIKEQIKSGIIKIDDVDFSSIVEKLYRERGYYNSHVKYRVQKSADQRGTAYHNFYFEIKKGERVRVDKVSYRGNYHRTDSELKNIYLKHATVLAKRGFLDDSFLKKFRAALRRSYVQSGFVFTTISNPKVVFSDVGSSAAVAYDISEGKKTMVKRIRLINVSRHQRKLLLSRLKNKKKHPLDVTSLQGDFDRVINFVRKQGYYYAVLSNLDSPDLLQYSSDYSYASINIELDIGKRAQFNRLVIAGNRRTRDIVIEREIDLKSGEMITPDIIEAIRLRLIARSLFAKITINPVIINRDSDDENYLVNLVIQVKEKDYRELELAPGYRTDIGWKLSSAYSYHNIGGMGRSFTLRGQLNDRVDYISFDTRRQEERKRLLEYRFEAEFAEPYLFPATLGKGIDFKASAILSRRRFFGFDGDIAQSSARIAKKITTNTTLSLKYQLETINQYNATEEADSGYFRIGSITPAVMHDKRDDNINTRNGYFLSLSAEFANDLFWSLNRDDLEINYYKLVSRNKYYYQISPGWGIATQIAGGFQKNLATQLVTDGSGELRTRGHIPSIKVFRLDGIDLVRGFTSNEINLLGGDQAVDISKARVDGEAYFANFKVELRNYIDDKTILAFFADAGRVFVDTYRPLDLRSAVGVSLKFITPVGSMDFDYGVKTRRKRTSDGSKEQVGRFHLSIGFF
ncbi:MAG: BamA/TamA family outer membrane protein [Bdellovibrionales bacterium]|jgi:outer membrane protein insertion porin family|nr:BamA/TamA family outer membrane protein [Bdellovibrionales bacterium]MBT3526113.1 BamA/TamA family outer membrane protein [Bdellovibrionales bacterium]MBT7766966.1 BamA/TamA family outer membrane protein [Bdellovibrionales bacterium]